MTISSITSLVSKEFEAVNQTILTSLASDVPEIPQIGEYLIQSGGKRIRPLLVLLSAKACGNLTQPAITMAAIIEFIHTATLLHDDVVDDSKMRRGKLTANRVWDNASAVLVGDFLYSRAFEMMVALGSMPAMGVLAETTNQIAEGEVMQLTHRFQPDIDETRYLRVIYLKTAKLFEAASQLGAILTGQTPEVTQALKAYGKHLGMAFQLMDDLLDYQAQDAAWGKNIGADLAEGKATLPLIYAITQSPDKQANYLRDAIKSGKISELSLVQEAIASTGAVDYVMRVAQQAIDTANEALSCLPDSAAKTALIDLGAFALGRGS